MPSTTAASIQPKRSRPIPPVFRSLRHRNYRLWFIGQGISLVGTWMQTMMADGIGAPLSVGIGAIISLIYGLFVAVRFPILRKQ